MKHRLKKRWLYVRVLAFKQARHWMTDEEYAWEFMPPVGSEFGSPTMRERRRYTVEELLKNVDPDALLTPEMQAVLDIAPVGREFGSGSPEDPARVPDASQASKN